MASMVMLLSDVVAPEGALQGAAHRGLVVDHEDLHRLSPPTRRAAGRTLPNAGSGDDDGQGMDRRLRYGVAAVAALVVLVAAFAVGRATSDDRRVAASAGPTTTTAATTTTLAGPTTTTQPVLSSTPPTTGSPATAAPPGKVVSAADSLLQAAPQPTLHSTQGPNVSCQTLADAGWTATCARVDMAGGTRVWLTEAKPSGPFKAWRAYVLHFSQGKGAWLVDLRYTDDGGSPGMTDIKVVASDLTADGKPELVFGFRVGGTGSILSYDVVVEGVGGLATVAASRSLSHGSASVQGGVITDFEAKYPNGEPNCCPGYVQQSTVSWAGGTFRVVDGKQQSVNAPRGNDL